MTSCAAAVDDNTWMARTAALRRAAVLPIVLALALPAPAAAWGFEAHRFVTDRAIDLLPPELRPYFQKYRPFIVEHTIDPDLWRSAGFEEEPPRHFVDLDAYGRPPFDALPHDYNAAVAKFGRERVDKNGLLPWRTAEMHERLTRAFRQQADGTSGYAYEDVKFFSAIVSHYVGDAHVPLHSVLNYDGQLTNQHGIHGRFESELFRRYQSRLDLKPRNMAPVLDAREFIFSTLADSFKDVEPLLDADRRAVAGRAQYDDGYYDMLFASAGSALQRRLSDSIAAVAAAITGAWERAGKPPLPVDPPRANRKVRSPSR